MAPPARDSSCRAQLIALAPSAEPPVTTPALPQASPEHELEPPELGTGTRTKISIPPRSAELAEETASAPLPLPADEQSFALSQSTGSLDRNMSTGLDPSRSAPERASPDGRSRAVAETPAITRDTEVSGSSSKPPSSTQAIRSTPTPRPAEPSRVPTKRAVDVWRPVPPLPPESPPPNADVLPPAESDEKPTEAPQEQIHPYLAPLPPQLRHLSSKTETISTQPTPTPAPDSRRAGSSSEHDRSSTNLPEPLQKVAEVADDMQCGAVMRCLTWPLRHRPFANICWIPYAGVGLCLLTCCPWCCSPSLDASGKDRGWVGTNRSDRY